MKKINPITIGPVLAISPIHIGQEDTLSLAWRSGCKKALEEFVEVQNKATLAELTAEKRTIKIFVTKKLAVTLILPKKKLLEPTIMENNHQTALTPLKSPRRDFNL